MQGEQDFRVFQLSVNRTLPVSQVKSTRQHTPRPPVRKNILESLPQADLNGLHAELKALQAIISSPPACHHSNYAVIVLCSALFDTGAAYR